MRLCKLMWLPGRNMIFGDVRTNDPLIMNYRSTSKVLNSTLGKYFDLDKWHNDYTLLYHSWLDDKSDEISDINSKINSEAIDAVKKVNAELKKMNTILFYWFDIDRSLYPDWIWVNNPIDNKMLDTLDFLVSSNNRKVCLEHFLIFPDITDRPTII